MHRTVLTLVLLALGGSVAQAGEARCAAGAQVRLPAGLEAWDQAGSELAGAGAVGAVMPAITPGRVAQVRLRPAGEVRFAMPPQQARDAEAPHGGLLSLSIAEAGIYRVAASMPLWTDVVRGGRAVRSTAHGRPPGCHGVRKVVDFPLSPGDYVVQLSGNAGPAVRLLVMRDR